MGCGGRGSVRRVNMFAGRLSVSGHGAQDVGAVAYGKTVWSWHPWLMSSCRWLVWSNRIDQPSSRQRWRQKEFVSRESAA